MIRLAVPKHHSRNVGIQIAAETASLRSLAAHAMIGQQQPAKNGMAITAAVIPNMFTVSPSEPGWRVMEANDQRF